MSDKYLSQKNYAKKNIKAINVTFQKDFVIEFKEACAKLGIKQADVFRSAMLEVIEKLNEEVSTSE